MAKTMSDDELRAAWQTSENFSGPHGYMVRFVLLRPRASTRLRAWPAVSCHRTALIGSLLASSRLRPSSKPRSFTQRQRRRAGRLPARTGTAVGHLCVLWCGREIAWAAINPVKLMADDRFRTAFKRVPHGTHRTKKTQVGLLSQSPSSAIL